MPPPHDLLLQIPDLVGRVRISTWSDERRCPVVIHQKGIRTCFLRLCGQSLQVPARVEMKG